MLTVIGSDGCKRYVLRADEKLTAFIGLESAIRNGQRLASSDWLGAAREVHKSAARDRSAASKSRGSRRSG